MSIKPDLSYELSSTECEKSCCFIVPEQVDVFLGATLQLLSQKKAGQVCLPNGCRLYFDCKQGTRITQLVVALEPLPTKILDA